jgi:ankyrin repeat protein
MPVTRAAAAAAAATDNFARVHRAVAAGESAEEVRRLIAEYADEQMRVQAVNMKSQNNNETPLATAHRLQRGNLVGALLEAGADASKLFRRATPLVVCIAHGQVESVRVLLKAGHDPNQRIEYGSNNYLVGSASGDSCTAAHLCLTPPRLSDAAAPGPPPQLACLEVLVQEGKADVNAKGYDNYTPLHWLAMYVPPGDAHLAALDLLLRLGADVDARGGRNDETSIFKYARKGYPTGPQRLLGRGASADVANSTEHTPLMLACVHLSDNDSPERRDVALALLRASSRQTRRAVSLIGSSAVDIIITVRYGR